MARYNDSQWRASMKLKFDYNNMMSEYLGEEHGIARSDLEWHVPKARIAHKYFKEHRGTGMMGWTELPYNQSEVVKDIKETARMIRKNFKYFVVLGIGGSALGGMAVCEALLKPYWNMLTPEQREGML